MCGQRLKRAELEIGAADAGGEVVVARRDVALVRDVHQEPGQELQRVHRLGPRRWPLRLVGAIRHRLSGPVVRQPLQRDGIAGAVAREAHRERAIVLGDPDGGVPVKPGVRPRQHA